MKKILIITGGGANHLHKFSEEAKELKLNVTVASFDDMTYLTNSPTIKLEIKGINLQKFNIIYIRLVGKHFEKAAVLVKFAYDFGIRIVDKIFERREFTKLPLPKSLEVKTFIDNKIPTPQTYFGTLENIKKEAPRLFGYPFVIKGTTGKQGNAVWSPRNPKGLSKILNVIEKRNLDMNFIAQPFIRASQRVRIFVVGGRALAAITRPTRWRNRFTKKVKGEYVEGIRTMVDPIPREERELAILASKTLGIDIAGVDLVRDDFTGKLYVLEVNSAPRWESIRSETKLNPEAEILKYLNSGV